RLDLPTGAPGSRYGSELSLVAPGIDIYTTSTIAAQYESVAGTSIAAAHVAGVAAVARSVNPGLTAPDLKTLLIATATKITRRTPGATTECCRPIRRR